MAPENATSPEPKRGVNIMTINFASHYKKLTTKIQYFFAEKSFLKTESPVISQSGIEIISKGGLPPSLGIFQYIKKNNSQHNKLRVIS